MPGKAPAHGTLHVFDDPDALAAGVGIWFCEQANAVTGPVIVSLSGGSTPKRLYQHLADAPLCDRLPWDRIHWTFGDERFVPPDDAQSNLRMVREAMFDHAPVPPANIHAFQTVGVSPDQSASAHEQMLRGLATHRDGPLFDITLLGLGDDGHTASLIPGEPIVQERARWVGAVPHGRDVVRLSLTLPAIDSSRHVAFLVTGAGKRAMLDRVLAGDNSLPAGMVRPQGTLHFFADRDAAGTWA